MYRKNYFTNKNKKTPQNNCISGLISELKITYAELFLFYSDGVKDLDWLDL